MKRKVYQEPMTKVVKLQHHTHLLQASGQKSGQMVNPDDYELEDDPFNF